jgi:hypothetical protein
MLKTCRSVARSFDRYGIFGKCLGPKRLSSFMADLVFEGLVSPAFRTRYLYSNRTDAKLIDLVLFSDHASQILPKDAVGTQNSFDELRARIPVFDDFMRGCSGASRGRGLLASFVRGIG